MIYLFTLLLLSSCKQELKSDVVIIEAFPIKKELKSTVITVPPIILAPAHMCVSEDKLIIMYQKKDTILDLFQLPECKYLFSAGIRGGGPDDFPSNFDTRSFQPTEGGISITSSYGLLKQFIVDEKKLVNIKNLLINTDYLDYPVNGFRILSDTMAFALRGLATDINFEFIRIDTRTNKNHPFSAFPDWTNEFWVNEIKSFVYIKNTVAHPAGIKFASFYGFFKRWRIYDNETNMIRDIAVNIAPYSEKIKENVSERIAYYHGYPCATNKYVYALCKNREYADDSATETELQVWDWDGNPIAVFTLDQKIRLIAVSEKEKKIYALNSSEGHEDKIYVYDVPE